MSISRRHTINIFVLLLLLPTIALVHLFVGQIGVDSSDYFNALFHYDTSDSYQIIAREIRIPRMFMAIIAGAGLSIAGLLMQTLFNNPLAGPYVLGINSGASLFVAFSIMTGIPFFTSTLGITANALIGAFVFGIIILFFSRFLRSQVSLLLVGLMLGSFTGAIVSLTQTISEADELKVFTLWALGSLQKVKFEQLLPIFSAFTIGILLTTLTSKSLNILVIGEENARLLGVNIKRSRLFIISLTALFTGLVTAFCGPIAFIGLAVPNLVRMIFKTQSHITLLISSALTGAIFILLCDICIQLIEAHFMIPINVFTSIVGAPFVVFIILKKLR
ncbi:MAG: iron ABC transporter permease [Crocinitomicaceae bacterium]